MPVSSNRNIQSNRPGLAWILLICVGANQPAVAEEPDAERGLELLRSRAFVRPTLDQEVFDELWRDWPEPLRTEAAQTSQEGRRRLAFARYGLTEAPGDDSGDPLQFVVDENGSWSANCFTCHGGKIGGSVIWGLPNSQYAAETLLEDVYTTSIRLEKPLPEQNYVGDRVPLGSSIGVTNAVTLSFILLANRDADLNHLSHPSRPAVTHFDIDPPPWWRLKRRERLYADGFARKSHRALMQMLLDSDQGAEHFVESESDFRDVLAWIESLEPPAYPFPVDDRLASSGRAVFETNCAECHGTYGPDGSYPEMTVPLEEIGTDPVRLTGVSAESRRAYEQSWFAWYGEHEVVPEPEGYVAPPLDGVWATAPYFHNGSVPTLWDVLHPEQRPVVWQRSPDGFDRARIGLEFESFESIPDQVQDPSQRRTFFDTRQFGKSSEGHTFPDVLSESEKLAVLEYLKTL